MSVPEHQAEARRWLQYAREDLLGAREIFGSTAIARHACWLAQQAAEKALKALLISEQVEHPRSHDLDLLWNLLPRSIRSHSENLELSELTEWAVEARYPGDWPEASSVDADRAIQNAEKVLNFVVNELGM